MGTEGDLLTFRKFPFLRQFAKPDPSSAEGREALKAFISNFDGPGQ